MVDQQLRDSDMIYFCQPEIIRKCLVEDLKRYSFIRENDADGGTETYSIALSRLDIFFESFDPTLDEGQVINEFR